MSIYYLFPDIYTYISEYLLYSSKNLEVLLVPWELVYDIFIPGNWPKTSSFRLPYQCHSSSADCARELFSKILPANV